MEARIGTAWSAQANNPYYRIRELTLPALTSTGQQRFDFKTTFLPHAASRVLVKSKGQQRDTEIIVGQQLEFESGAESEIVNLTNQELRFTVMEFK
jgi:hypothetical protein